MANDIWQKLAMAGQAPNMSPMNGMASYQPSQTNAAGMLEMSLPKAQMPSLQAMMPAQLPKGVKEMSVGRKTTSNGGGKYESELDDAFKALLDNRGGSIQKLQAKLAEAEGTQPGWLESVNLRPMLAFADQLTGGKSSYNYAAPNAKEARAAQIAKLEEQIMRQEGSLSDDQMNYLKMKASEESQNSRLKMSIAAGERSMAKSDSNDEDKIRKQYMGHPLYKNMGDIENAYTAVENNPADNGPAQQALVFQFSKILDPGSVVRETEYAQSAANMGKINEARQLFQRLQSGEMLNPDQIRKMKDVSRNLVQSSRASLDKHNAIFTELAMRKGHDPRNVVLDPFFKGKQAAAGPQIPIGTVEDGMKFLGGDPAKPESWSAVK